jgi:23S rRNA (adenine2503-C2)-methyltransferase
MTDLLNLDADELELFVRGLGQAPFRARQLWKWIWAKGAHDFAVMSDLSRSFRAELEKHARISRPEIVRTLKATDGTVKFLLRLEDGESVESVLIPSESREGRERLTLCLSCQVGCPMGCTFCGTGSMGFVRDMSAAEILGQVRSASGYLADASPDAQVRNLVFMGMGEPLLNLDAVMRSLRILNSESGPAFSPRRITVSTCGVERGLKVLGASGLAYLAVSLHAPNQALRSRIMPAAASFPLESLMSLLRAYPLRARERLTFEYLLLGGVNDSPAEAAELAALMSRVKGKLNLILHNPAEGSPYRAPDEEAAAAFEAYLRSRHITATVRKSKGSDILAACGQLRSASRKTT